MPAAQAPDRPRLAGVTVPLFSLRTHASWGIGEIGDLVPAASWLASYGVSLIQILPLGEIGSGERSPYSSLSAFGIDPIYLSVEAIEDLAGGALREAVGGDMGTVLLERARGAARVEYDDVRFVKNRALRHAYAVFAGAGTSGARVAEFDAFVKRESYWLADYSLFRALKDAHGGRAWWEWPAGLRDREPAAMALAAKTHENEVRYYRYLQWLAAGQWARARTELAKLGVEVMGDLPFMVGRDSADVWANPGEFRNDMDVGVPADQFDPDGQDWGLPPYRWDAMRANDFAWLRRRARAAAGLYDRFRIDHLVGFFRTYMRPKPVRGADGKLVKGVFDPPEERVQKTHGPRVVRAMMDAAREKNATLVAEDLGTVPPWVRVALTDLGVPGYKVLVWEKDEDVYRDPAGYPAVSVACFGTHDTDPVSVWWDGLDEAGRAAVCALPGMKKLGITGADVFGPRVHAALLGTILASPSELVLLLVQDALGTSERVNVPGTVGPSNWSYRLAEPIEELRVRPSVQSALERVRDAVAGAGRTRRENGRR